MNKRERIVLPAVGGCSLLVSFAVLCLTVFALLCLSKVQADRRLSDAAAQTVSAWYEADLAAEEILACLRSGELPEDVTVDGDIYSYICPISETQQLHVEVQCVNGNWEILNWKAVSVTQWDENASLTVWDGETLS